jgi:hypothetical protein
LSGCNLREFSAFEGGCRIFFQERRADKPDKERIGHQGLHGLMQLATLRPVALINKNEEIPLRMAGL